MTGSGRQGIVSEDTVAAAIQRPFNGYYNTIYQRAGVLLFSLATYHGYTDGNKRTAFLMLNLFLDRSGYKLVEEPKAERERELVEFIERAANANLGVTVEDTIGWIKTRIIRK